MMAWCVGLKNALKKTVRAEDAWEKCDRLKESFLSS